jgi:hypothetical protein
MLEEAAAVAAAVNEERVEVLRLLLSSLALMWISSGIAFATSGAP